MTNAQLKARIRATLAQRLRLVVTKRARGPFVLTRPDGLQTEHATKKEALVRMLTEAQVHNTLTWQVHVLLRPENPNEQPQCETKSSPSIGSQSATTSPSPTPREPQT